MLTLALIWRSAGTTLAIDATQVIEVLPPLTCDPMPGVPGFIRGLFTHRGRLVPLVDAATLLGGMPEAGARMADRVIVVRAHFEREGQLEGADRADHVVRTDDEGHAVGLWVERVLDLDRVDFAAPDGHPGFETEAARFLGPVAVTRWGQVQLVHTAELFTPDESAILVDRLREAAA